MWCETQNLDDTGIAASFLKAETLMTNVCMGYARTKDGILCQHKQMACHAYFRHNQIPKGTTELYSSLWKNSSVTYENAEKWWNYLFDKVHSPWRTILKHITVLYVDGRMVGFKINNLDSINGQTFLNFLVATRMPREQPPYINMFCLLCEHKYTRYEAICIGFDFRLARQGAVAERGKTTHYFFNDSPSFENVRKAQHTLILNPKTKKPRLYLEPVTITLNSIWLCDNKNVQAIKDELAKVKDEKVSLIFNKLMAMKQKNSPKEWNVDTFLEALKKARTTWKKPTTRQKKGIKNV